LKAGFIGVSGVFIRQDTGGILASNTKKLVKSSKDKDSLSEIGLKDADRAPMTNMDKSEATSQDAYSRSSTTP
jgi:hypothetical protein